jgi:hypothetical protein
MGLKSLQQGKINVTKAIVDVATGHFSPNSLPKVGTSANPFLHVFFNWCMRSQTSIQYIKHARDLDPFCHWFFFYWTNFL